jgi:hypothetical protein
VVFLSTVIAVAISATWLDKPIAILVHDTFGRSRVLGGFTGTPSFYSPLVIFILLVLFVRRLAFRPFGKLDMVLILCDVSIILAKLIMPPLKFLFGRTWPTLVRLSLVMACMDSTFSTQARDLNLFLRATWLLFLH